MSDVTLDKIRQVRFDADIAIAAAELTVARAVDEARTLNRSWEDIGRALGISRQAAWERYGKGFEDPHPPTS